MALRLQALCITVAMMGAPAVAQSDPHADHHPATAVAAPPEPATTPAAKAHCDMMSTQVPDPLGAQHKRSMPMQGAQGPGMMGEGMSPDMMKECRATVPADRQHGN